VRAITGIDVGVTYRVKDLGLDVVEVEWAGTDRKPMIRVRIDLPDSAPGQGVTVEHCAVASRAIEGWLDVHPAIPEKYVLEVSSPGVERPLTRKRDFVRFAGREVKVRTTERAQGDGHAPQLSGVLEGVEGGGDEYSVVICVTDGARVTLPRSSIDRANLVFHWNEDG